ncbi:transporter substrate-binding domain-containing protein [Pseudodesulfovibrio sp. JC047]|uniref:ABC transporter substrate-binding protein n=1 Tax=Pseudodesulfovibrio sp. JC047 TaxID=2683199 RepID=UPI0013D83E63|nr:ABC transporter substrate-binding protein [Pseudodesulfovibrio sp. JC047]NDV19080.1 transporter substrate-binding domain-containing protein [Pseudodesulfovibrio sp. JC047]
MKRILLLVLSCILLTATYALAGQTELTFSSGAGPMAGALNIARIQGYMAENGIDGKIHSYKNGKQSFDKYLAGIDDFGTCSIIPIVLTDFDTTQHRLVGTLSYTDNQTKVLVRKSAGIQTVADLKGKTIATVNATTAHFYISKFLEINGVSCDDVKIVFLTKKAMPEAIATRQVDALCMHGMPIENAKKLLGDDWAIFEDGTILRKYVVMVTSTKMVTETPDTLKGVLRAVLKADDFLKKNIDTSISILAKDKRYPLAVMDETVRHEMDYDLSIRQSLLLMLEDVEKWAIENQLVSRKTPRNYLELIAFEPLEAIAPNKVTLIH